jgi:hypothetical protein
MKTRLSWWKAPGKLTFCLAVLLWRASLPLFGQGAAPFQLTDDFASRPIILGPDYWIVGSLSNATIEAGEPFIPGVSSGQTVWGSWTAPSNGIVVLSADAQTFSPLLTVYAGSDFTNFSLVASNNYLICYEDGDCGCHWRERQLISFHVTRRQTYQICVDSAIFTDASIELQEIPVTFNGNTFTFTEWAPTFTTNILQGGAFTLNFQFTPAPANDNFNNRVRLSGPRIATHVSNTGATKEVGEPDHLGNPGGSSVWYSWTAPASGRVTLSTNDVPAYAPPSSGPGDGLIITPIGPPTCGNEIDQNPPPVFYPIFAAYKGTAVDALTPADNLLMALDAYPNAVAFDAVKGQIYQIAFDGNMGTAGEIPFFLALTTPAPNANFNSRIQLHGVSVAATGYNAGATHQSGAPVLTGSAGKTAWWSWTAPVPGSVSLDLTGSDYSFPLAVFTGPSLPGLQMVAEGTGGLSFNASRGQTYQIAVSDDNGLTGTISLNLLGPIVDLPLERTAKRGNVVTLTYGTSPGEIVALLFSTDNENWTIVQKTTASVKMVSFQVKQAPTQQGPFYRAIIFDDVSFDRRAQN